MDLTFSNQFRSYSMKTITATYNYYIDFDIPDDVYEYLQPQPKGKDLKAVGRCYILNGTFHYNDTEGIERQIEGNKPEMDSEIVELVNDEEVYNDE
jgi:hypothetical protein